MVEVLPSELRRDVQKLTLGVRELPCASRGGATQSAKSILSSRADIGPTKVGKNLQTKLAQISY